MSDGRRLTPVREEDYELIEQAVMETPRGRWFLAEYARRNRAADTRILLDAIKRLERVVSAQTVEFVPSLESSNAVHKIRGLLRDALSDVTAILASTGSEADRIEARSDAFRSIDSRLSRQSADLDELILILRSAHNDIATETSSPETRRRLARAVEKLAKLSKNHHGVALAVRRGLTLLRTLDQALADERSRTGTPSMASKAEILPPDRRPAGQAAVSGNAEPSARPSQPAADKAETKGGEDGGAQGRIVIVRKPSAALTPLPDFAEEAPESPSETDDVGEDR
ncbi:hypothetical protein [Rhodoligotrophos defluvii]|uniref:hypothetical protein n=1 Tax=Rhodoligotrophos defluvii TaxID=2561934 RepID=UPI0010CA0720|nr:hypothetical protein [Rhodoligotrophos defluvii]